MKQALQYWSGTPGADFNMPSRLKYARLSAVMYLRISSVEWLEAISSFFVGVSIP